VLHFGDFGEVTPSQRAVADAMAAEARRAPVDLALSAGDNVYECGVDPRLPGASACAFDADGNGVTGGATLPADPQFAEKFEDPLRGLLRDGQPVPTWLVLGNHDVNPRGECAAGPDPVAVARTKACLQVAHRSPRWKMPGRHWVLDLGPARFVGIDSNLLKGDYGGFTIDGEVAFVQQAFAGCESRTCFLVAHHPSFSAGEHRADATPEYLRRVALVERASAGRIAAWLAGHEHQLEHLRSPSGHDVLVSAATARPRPGEPFSPLSAPGTTLLWASSTPGFGVLEVRSGGWSYRFLDAAGNALHCCEASVRGACRPASCAP
jgi:3',5'-cyclic AMP phosphodiesterase CpdA